MSIAPLTIDVGGLVGPGAGGQTADVLRQAAAQARAERLADLFEEQSDRTDGDVAASLRAARDALQRCPAAVRAHALATPAGALDVPSRPGAAEAGFPARPDALRALVAIRSVVGVTEVGDLTLVLPAAAFAEGLLLLPHLGVAVDAGRGPLAVLVRDGTVSLTWADGQRATLACDGGCGLPVGAVVDGLTGVQARCGLAVLNACGAINRAFAHFGLATAGDQASLLAAHLDGLALLRTTWPDAADMADRFLDAVLLLAPRAGTRSHTSARLHGAVLSSADNAVSVGDILCHELAHSRIQLFLEHDPLLHDDGEERHFSPWRPDPRPLLGVLLGVHAFVDVCGYYRRLAEHGFARDVAETIYERQSAKVRTGMALLREKAAPTPLGELLLDELEMEVTCL